ncbi:MAG: alpha-amylase family glycosyl hydrolase [Pedobacter sp.]|nr:alpha-amylase family glycosyl hydrolase [Pedobacter sp.]MDQ8051571.1 alpha-amylase family glycosyl hydrolase [Pedobacter sp.]
MQFTNHLWWHRSIIYQVYPRSFQDSNGDGIGDLLGIALRLDYLHALGIEAIWLSPIFPSPMADFGYDVADYVGIHPIFGSMDDFDQLLREAHQRGIKVLLDLVPNHSSDQHPWFLESRSSKTNAKRDWYIWKDANEDGTAPNNWLSVFGGSGWEWDAATGQYYYHGFLKEQPDLNWRNPEVVAAMLAVMRFWFDKGIDGFRVDVLWHIFKQADFLDNPQNPDFAPHMPSYDSLLPIYSTDQPEVHDIVKKMRALADEYEERVIIGEIYLPHEKLMAYYGEKQDGIHLPFNFTLINIEWKAQVIAAAVDAYEQALPTDAWPNWVLGNHDRPRIATRIGKAQARVAAMLLLTLRGTPTMYYGDEIGMEDVYIPQAEIQDPQGLNMPDLNMGRDPVRTPMQWSAGPYAGFTTAVPWLRLGADYTTRNVMEELKDPYSMLSLYKQLIALRKAERSLLYGDYQLVFADHQLMAYTRRHGSTTAFLVVLNLSGAPATFHPPMALKGEVIIAATGKTYDWTTGPLALLPDEGIVVRLKDQ